MLESFAESSTDPQNNVTTRVQENITYDAGARIKTFDQTTAEPSTVTTNHRLDTVYNVNGLMSGVEERNIAVDPIGVRR